MLATPSYVVTAKRLTMPIVSTKAKAEFRMLAVRFTGFKARA
jgi:hypothetical protein